MPERAEIEEVARVWWSHESPATGVPWQMVRERTKNAYRARAVEVIEALDRVRDARGDDEGARAMEIAGDIARDHARRFPDGEPSCSSCGVRLDQDNSAEDATCCDYCVAKAARSPQGEDHEAGIEAMEKRLRDWSKYGGTMPTARQLAGAYIRGSRVSPSRDGTVAVENIRVWAERFRRSSGVWPDWEQIERIFLAEFGPARAGESNER